VRIRRKALHGKGGQGKRVPLLHGREDLERVIPAAGRGGGRVPGGHARVHRPPQPHRDAQGGGAVRGIRGEREARGPLPPSGRARLGADGRSVVQGRGGNGGPLLLRCAGKRKRHGRPLGRDQELRSPVHRGVHHACGPEGRLRPQSPLHAPVEGNPAVHADGCAGPPSVALPRRAGERKEKEKSPGREKRGYHLLPGRGDHQGGTRRQAEAPGPCAQGGRHRRPPAARGRIRWNTPATCTTPGYSAS